MDARAGGKTWNKDCTVVVVGDAMASKRTGLEAACLQIELSV